MISIREYCAADRAACLALFEGNVPEYFHPSEREGFERFLDEWAENYLVIEDGGLIVSCGGYEIATDARRADFCWGMIARDRHHQGLGRILAMERIARIAATAAADTLALETTQHSAGFFERLGFRTESIKPAGFAPGMDLYAMTRPVVLEQVAT